MANIWEPGHPPDQGSPEKENKNKTQGNLKIVGFNLLALVAYTCIFAITSGGPWIDAVFLFFHVITCFILAAANRSLGWLLSAVAVLLIGFSSCAEILFKLN